MSARDPEDLATFERLRPELIALAYRMLGDAARAQDAVQDAWLRWHGRQDEVSAPRAFLITVVTRLCLNELAASDRRARAGVSLPEPVDLRVTGMAQLETLEQVSIAFLWLLERLTPTERAAFLLHEAFEFSHEEIAPLIECSEATCRKHLQRARAKLGTGRKLLTASRAEHERLLASFLQATQTGDTTTLLELLAPDATLLTDGGPSGRTVGRIRNLQRPLIGAARIVGFITAANQAVALTIAQHELNGRPALVFHRQGQPFAALLLEIADGKIHSLFFQGDPAKLRFLGPAQGAGSPHTNMPSA